MNARSARVTRSLAVREIAINEIVRAARSHITGTRTTVERAGSSEDHWLGMDDEWAVICEEHGTVVGADSRHDACLFGAHPERFCAKCEAIAFSLSAAGTAVNV